MDGGGDARGGVEQEVVAPHHGLVDAEAVGLVVGAVLEHALPLVVVAGQEVRLAEPGEDAQRVLAVVAGADRGGGPPRGPPQAPRGARPPPAPLPGARGGGPPPPWGGQGGAPARAGGRRARPP